jgi:hypothetical protein
MKELIRIALVVMLVSGTLALGGIVGKLAEGVIGYGVNALAVQGSIILFIISLAVWLILLDKEKNGNNPE